MSTAVETVQTDVKKNLRAESFWGSVFRHLRKNKPAIISLIFLIILILMCIFVPIFSPHSISATGLDEARQAPCLNHWMGTDDLGRDLFVRFFYGGRISLTIAFWATLLTSFVGVLLGAVSGFYGKWADTVIMRISEMFMSFPFLLTAITISTFFGGTVRTLVIVFTALGWPGICRIIRGQILTLRDLEYMHACEALGISDFRKVVRHILPNVLAYVIVYATLSIASVILGETALSFLGLGISPPTPTWGGLIQEARSVTVLTQRWWYWIPPGVGIFLTVMSFNVLGDGLRDAIDPKMKR